MTTQHKCCGNVGTWRFEACGKNAKFDRDGKHYCGTHDPVSKDARLEAKRVVWRVEHEQHIAAHNKKTALAAEQKRRADCYDDLLEALKMALGFVCIEGNDQEINQAKAAIAKATGAA